MYAGDEVYDDAVTSGIHPDEAGTYAQEPDPEPCAHDNVEHDDDGGSKFFFICLDCDRTVYLTPPDEDGKSYWEVIY